MSHEIMARSVIPRMGQQVDMSTRLVGGFEVLRLARCGWKSKRGASEGRRKPSGVASLLSPRQAEAYRPPGLSPAV